MPKTDIDYSNTIIYKITCKDKSIKDLYVGHTTNFVQRKHMHKQNCINNKTSNYKCKLYEVIRDNGGWNNWHMEIINFFDCKDHYEARKKEQEYFISLNATLNSIEPLPKPKCIVPKCIVPKCIVPKCIVPNNKLNIPKEKKVFFCNTCNIYCSNNNIFDIHNKTKKHIKTVSQKDTPKSPKKPFLFTCDFCHISTSNKKDYSKHLLTAKHLKTKIDDAKIHEIPKNPFRCECGNIYKHNSGLWRHKKLCNSEQEENIIIENTPEEVKNLTSMVMELIKSNTEMQKQMVDMCKNSNNTINSHNNNNNKTFNLQFFLNEQCKDAMNISDFANSITLDLSDFESVGELGYVEGITKIMLDKLNSMDIYKRPIHCSDAKREILYVKDHDVWEKEEKNNPKLRYAIKTISFNNMKLMALWSSTYPESMDGESRLNDKYMKLIKQSTGGNGEIRDSEDKIIRRIAKEIVIGKNKM